MDAADIDLLHRLADAADQLTLPSWRSGDFTVEIKPDGSPVTTTDQAVEEALLALVAEHRPTDAFLGEEVGPHPGSSGRTWVVDGIDGTRNFVDLTTRWSTLIALEIDGVAVAGTVTSPALDRRWSSTADGRALLGDGEAGHDPAPLAVSATAELEGARIAVWPPDDWAVRMVSERHTALLDLVGDPTPASAMVNDSIPHGAIPVADGRIDAMVAFSGQAWDHGGPSAVVAAAGGRFSAIDGRARFDTGAGVYSNGLLHDELVAVLAAG